MPIRLNQAQLSIKDENGRYIGINTIAEKLTTQQITDIQNTANAKKVEMQAIKDAMQTSAQGYVNLMYSGSQPGFPQYYATVQELDEHIIEISSEQPTSQANKLWINNGDVEEVQLSTIEDLNNIIAPAYSDSKTYSVGDYCIKDGYMYRCHTAISVAETWTTAHWIRVNVGGELSKTVWNELQNLTTAQQNAARNNIRAADEVTVAFHTSQIGNLETGKQDKLTFDSTPTAGSNNPVTSAGIKTMTDALTGDVDDLKSELEAFEAGENERQLDVGSIQEKYVSYSNGKIHASSSSFGHVGYIDISRFTKIKYSRIKTTSSSDIMGLAFYTGTGGTSDFITDSGIKALKNQSSAGYELTEVTVPETAKYVAFSAILDTQTYGTPQLIGVIENEVLDDIAELKNKTEHTQNATDEADCTVNYNYDTNFNRPANPSSGDSTKLGVVRNGVFVTLNGTLNYSSNYGGTRIKLSGDVKTTVMQETVAGESWAAGATELVAGHEYRVVMRSISGTFNTYPSLAVYPAGQGTSIGALMNITPTSSMRTFKAEQGTNYNIALFASRLSEFVNAKFSVLLFDMTALSLHESATSKLIPVESNPTIKNDVSLSVAGEYTYNSMSSAFDENSYFEIKDGATEIILQTSMSHGVYFRFYDADRNAIGNGGQTQAKKARINVTAEGNANFNADAKYLKLGFLTSEYELNSIVYTGMKLIRFVDANTYTESEADLFEEYYDKVSQIQNNTHNSKGFALQLFSDIHGDVTNLQRVIEFKRKYAAYLDDTLHLGDNVAKTISDGFDFWELTDGAETILNTIGNHDVWTSTSTGAYGYTESQAYSAYFADYIDGWGVTYSDGKTYYYKDYLEKGIRLIVLDVMFLSQEQETWFEATLASAKTGGLAVIVALHIPFAPVSGNNSYNVIDTPFANKYRMTYWSRNGYEENITGNYTALVDSFISGGGTFITWLQGHVHSAVFGTMHDYPNQLIIGVPNAGIAFSTDGGAIRTFGEKSQDSFYVLGVNTTMGYVKLCAIGNQCDLFMRTKDTLCYDYINHEMIFT